MTLDVPLSVKIEEWRKAATERPLTTDEMREIVRILRDGRIGAAATSARSRAAKAPVNVAGLESEIDDL
jgi:hypothetical protein